MPLTPTGYIKLSELQSLSSLNSNDLLEFSTLSSDSLFYSKSISFSDLSAQIAPLVSGYINAPYKWTDLIDTKSTLGFNGQIVTVSADTSGNPILAFKDESQTPYLSALPDVVSGGYAGKAGQFLAVKSDESGIIFNPSNVAAHQLIDSITHNDVAPGITPASLNIGDTLVWDGTKFSPNNSRGDYGVDLEYVKINGTTDAGLSLVGSNISDGTLTYNLANFDLAGKDTSRIRGIFIEISLNNIYQDGQDLAKISAKFPDGTVNILFGGNTTPFVTADTPRGITILIPINKNQSTLELSFYKFDANQSFTIKGAQLVQTQALYPDFKQYHIKGSIQSNIGSINSTSVLLATDSLWNPFSGTLDTAYTNLFPITIPSNVTKTVFKLEGTGNTPLTSGSTNLINGIIDWENNTVSGVSFETGALSTAESSIISGSITNNVAMYFTQIGPTAITNLPKLLINNRQILELPITTNTSNYVYTLSNYSTIQSNNIRTIKSMDSGNTHTEVFNFTLEPGLWSLHITTTYTSSVNYNTYSYLVNGTFSTRYSPVNSFVYKVLQVGNGGDQSGVDDSNVQTMVLDDIPAGNYTIFNDTYLVRTTVQAFKTQ